MINTSIMHGATERIEFGPPHEKRSASAFAWALFAHLLLLGALTWGVSWKRSDKTPAFDAEIWSAVPQQAAPRAVAPPPPAPAPPAPKPEPKAAEPPKPEPKPEPVKPQVDIALEQEKKRKALELKKEQEAAELKKEREREKALAEKEKALAEKEKALAEREKDKERKAAEEKKIAEAKKAELVKAQEARLAEVAAEKRRTDDVKRIMGMAGATGAADATGSAQRSSGPSSSYNGKVAAKVKPNVIFTEDIAGNPTAEVEVSTTADGTIISQRLIKSSGNKAWDEAVIKAIIRTGSMPRDTDGRVPTPMILAFRPKELL